jgi:hypothetical protein
MADSSIRFAIEEKLTAMDSQRAWRLRIISGRLSGNNPNDVVRKMILTLKLTNPKATRATGLRNRLSMTIDGKMELLGSQRVDFLNASARLMGNIPLVQKARSRQGESKPRRTSGAI